MALRTQWRETSGCRNGPSGEADTFTANLVFGKKTPLNIKRMSWSELMREAFEVRI